MLAQNETYRLILSFGNNVSGLIRAKTLLRAPRGRFCCDALQQGHNLKCMYEDDLHSVDALQVI